jgi:hypothetical protein
MFLEDKRMIEERLSMYDDLMEKDPKMRKIRAESEARGEARGEAKGAIKTLRMTILVLVKGRFPGLLEQAQQRVKHTTSVDELKQLFEQLASASMKSLRARFFFDRDLINYAALFSEQQAQDW